VSEDRVLSPRRKKQYDKQQRSNKFHNNAFSIEYYQVIKSRRMRQGYVARMGKCKMCMKF